MTKAFPIIIIICVVLVIIIAGYQLINFVRTRQAPVEDALVNKPVADDQVPPDKNQYNWSTMNEGPYNDQVSYATSGDLLNWADSKAVVTEHASVPGAVYQDGIIYCYFTDVAQDGIKEQVGVIHSEDQGKTWLTKVYVNIEGLGNKVAVDPDPFLMEDGQIRLYYFDIEEARQSMDSGSPVTNKIYSAISDDGINFVEEEGVRFAKEDIFDPDVIKVGDDYRMYVGDGRNNQVVVAVSSDGLNFQEEGVALDEGGIPNAFHDGSQYYLYTGGINIATSADGITFTPTQHSFHSEINPMAADPSVIQLADDSYLMFYKTKMEEQKKDCGCGDKN